jgi:hypothetical protein
MHVPLHAQDKISLPLKTQNENFIYFLRKRIWPGQRRSEKSLQFYRTDRPTVSSASVGLDLFDAAATRVVVTSPSD